MVLARRNRRASYLVALFVPPSIHSTGITERQLIHPYFVPFAVGMAVHGMSTHSSQKPSTNDQGRALPRPRRGNASNAGGIDYEDQSPRLK
jgi:hypothetical protein